MVIFKTEIMHSANDMDWKKRRNKHDFEQFDIFLATDFLVTLSGEYLTSINIQNKNVTQRLERGQSG